MFYGVGLLASRPAPKLWGRGIPYVWDITLDLSGMGGPTSSIQFFLGWKFFSHSCRENDNTNFMLKNFFPEDRVVYEIMWKNMVPPDRPRKTDIRAPSTIRTCYSKRRAAAELIF
jgi:hypothetical protein